MLEFLGIIPWYNKAVIVRIKSGLGNQLFQYALGRRIALTHKVPLKFDLSFYLDDPLRRNFGLFHFNIIGEIASDNEISAMTRIRAYGRCDYFLDKLVAANLFARPKVVSEKNTSFDPSVINSPGCCYLDGYWQSEKYFLDIEDTLRHELILTEKISSISYSVAQQIDNTTSVSIHIRRGDYISDSVTNQIHGVCSIDYYERAVKYIEQRISQPHFFVFSDDIDWANENISFHHPMTFMGQNGSEKDYENLYLMSICKHHIIANSSFSWWGAWLCNNNNKIVIAPKRWYNDIQFETADKVPPLWIRL